MAEKIAAFSGLERTLSVRGKVTYATGEEYALTGEDVIYLRITEGIETGLTPGSVLSAACAVMNDMATFDQAGIDDGYLDEIRQGDQFTVEGKV